MEDVPAGTYAISIGTPTPSLTVSLTQGMSLNLLRGWDDCALRNAGRKSGHESLLQFDVLGDAVNVAARVEQLTRTPEKGCEKNPQFFAS
jgi:hypothetical protein